MNLVSLAYNISMNIKEFSTKIKEEGIDYKTLGINPSIEEQYTDTKQDILDVLREYRDRVLWDHFDLKTWLWKYDCFREFREYYE